MLRHLVLLTAMAVLAAAGAARAVERGKPVHALALYGQPRHDRDFTHFDFVNPQAPKTGTLVRTTEVDRTFDTFNGFSVKGAPARAASLMHDTLMLANPDEVSAFYGLIADTVEVARDNTWVQFHVRPQATFSDGSPITAEDVAYSFEILTTKGRPIFRLYWSDVAKVGIIDGRTVRFTFKTADNRELPLILGQLPVLSKAYWSKRDFNDTSLEIPVVSGAYVVDAFEPGRFVAVKRRADYWGKDLAVRRGQNNFERIRYEYFRDADVQFEAFKKGEFDVYRSASAREWATGYDFPAAREGRVRKLEIADAMPMTTQSFVFNLRRPLFLDARVREALNYAFDFESLNRTVFYNSYTRLRSYWQKSELEAVGLPDSAELKVLEPLRGQVPARVFSSAFSQPRTDGQGNARENLARAAALLAEAGWTVRDGVLTKDGRAFTFEILLGQQGLDRVVLPFERNLERLGIKANLRVVDATQFINRLNVFDFDMTSLVLPYGLSPGNELTEDWGTVAADRSGSRNFGGVKDPALDSLAQSVIRAATREEVVAATRAFDRVLTWNFYRLLTYNSAAERYAVWDKVQGPPRPPLTGLGSTGSLIDTTWWANPDLGPNGAPVRKAD